MVKGVHSNVITPPPPYDNPLGANPIRSNKLVYTSATYLRNNTSGHIWNRGLGIGEGEGGLLETRQIMFIVIVHVNASENMIALKLTL